MAGIALSPNKTKYYSSSYDSNTIYSRQIRWEMMEKWWKSVYFPDLVICLQIMIPSPKSTILITTFQLNVPYSKWWSFDEDKSFGGGGSDCALPQISVLITPSNIHPFPSFKLINWFIIGYYGMPLGHCPKDKVLCMTWSCFSRCLHIT